MSFSRYLVASIPASLLLTSPSQSEEPVDPAGNACELAVEEPSSAVASLPFRTIDGRIYVDAMVNGTGPHIFAIDTGASGMGRADESLASALSLPADGEDESSDGISTAQVDKVRVESIALGGLVRHDLSVISRNYRSKVSPEAAFSGILGREFFADGLLVIDFPRHRLSFYTDRDMRNSLPGVMSYERAFRIPVTLGDMETVANLDTGANVTMVLPGSVAAELGAASLQAGGTASLTNGKMAISDARLAGPMRIGGALLEDIPVKIAAEYPEVLVGAHALQGQVLLIDQRYKTLAICTPDAPRAVSERAEQQQDLQE